MTRGPGASTISGRVCKCICCFFHISIFRRHANPWYFSSTTPWGASPPVFQSAQRPHPSINTRGAPFGMAGGATGSFGLRSRGKQRVSTKSRLFVEMTFRRHPLITAISGRERLGIGPDEVCWCPSRRENGCGPYGKHYGGRTRCRKSPGAMSTKSNKKPTFRRHGRFSKNLFINI